MAAKLYASTDASAPVLSGSAGALITVLDAILVNGYGTKAAAGWTKDWSSTNKAAYRVGPVAGVTTTPPIRYYLDVDDTGPNATDTTKSARMRGYETMTAVGTGTGAFPAAATAICLRKSATADATARAWVAFADETMLYFFAASGDTAGVYMTFGFGEFYSYLAGDNYKFIIMGRNEASASLASQGGINGYSLTGMGSAAQIGNYVARNYTGLGIGTQCHKIAHVPNAGATSSGYSVLSWVFPDARTGGLVMAPSVVGDGPAAATSSMHGELRGCFFCAHSGANFSDGDTFSGTGAYAGRTFYIVKATDTVSTNGGSATTPCLIIETTASGWARSV